MGNTLRARLANAIAAEILRQDYGGRANPLPADLTVPYLDQGEVDFGLVADVAEAVLREEMVDD